MQTHIFRRGLSAWFGMAFVLAGLQASQAADPVTFKVGISAPVVTMFPVWMAQAAGFDKKEGLNVEVVNMEGGTRGIQVLLSGEIQAMHVGLAPTILADKQGANLRLVNSSCNTIPITMFTPANLKTADDLKGKTFGISTFGSETDIAISILLKKLNLTRQDVTVSQIGGSGQRYAALVAGRIQVAPLIEPAITIAKEKGFNPLIDLAAANTPWIFDGIVVTADYIKDHRDTLTHFLRAYAAGAYLALSDESKAKEVIAQKFKTKDPKVIDATYKDFKRLMPLDVTPTKDDIANVIAQLENIGTELPDKNTSDYVDLSIMQKLKQDGYLDELAKAYPIK